MLGKDIKDSIIGIVGLGGIGLSIAQRLNGFEIAKIIYTGHNEKPTAKEIDAKFVQLEELLSESDIVFLSCSLNNSTEHLINENTLSKMKKTAVLINVSRGGVIDQKALTEALKNKTIFAAGLDVTTPEPLPRDHPLLHLSNCVITPHLGSATLETRKKMAYLTSLNILSGLQGRPMLTPVDL